MRNQLGLLIKLEKQEDIRTYLERVAALHFDSCQISTYVPALYTNENAELINEYCKKLGITVSLLWAGWPGKCQWDFLEGPTTVGLVPLDVRKERCDILKKASDFAALLHVGAIATHAGFIPENLTDPAYPALVETLREIALFCQKNGQWFCLETGQETPITLMRTIQDIGTGNVGVNLDPANLVMYGKGNPVDALKVLGPYVKGVHIKDGKYPVNGKELGVEVPIGKGDVQMPLFLKRLSDVGYQGVLTIEIELDRRVENASPEEAIAYSVAYIKRHVR